MLEGYYVTKKGENSKGPRVWLQGRKPQEAGFMPGQRYSIDVQGKEIILKLNADGTRTVSAKKKSQKSDELIPVIDLNGRELLAIFDGMASVQIVFDKDEIRILPLASEIRKQERYQRLRSNLESGEALTVGSASHGGGIMTNAIHHGLRKAGIETKLVFANEIRPELLEHAAEHNDSWDADTKAFAAPMQELAFDQRGLAMIPETNIFEIGIPCSGNSPSGKSKLGLQHPESHPHVGHLIVPTIVILNKANPAIAIFECVPEFSRCASAAILRTHLADMGYETHERILNGVEWGTYENRNRWFMIAVTQGISFDFGSLMPPVPIPRNIKDVLDPIGPDDPRWVKMEGLKLKEERDKAAGKGFVMQIYTEDDECVNVINKLYAKVQSTTPKLRHPTNPELLRQFTPREHARIKGIPEALVITDDISDTTQHEILGQSCIYKKVEGLSEHLGGEILSNFPKRLKLRNAEHSCATINRNEFTPEFIRLSKLVVNNSEKAKTDDILYHGDIVAVDRNHAIQRIGKDQGVVHQLSLLLEQPNLGEAVTVTYREGNGFIGRADDEDDDPVMAMR